MFWQRPLLVTCGDTQWDTLVEDTGTVPQTGDTVPPCEGTQGLFEGQDVVIELGSHESCHR